MKVLAALAALIVSATTSAEWVQVRGGNWTPDAQMVAGLKAGVKEQFERGAEAFKESHGAIVPSWDSYSFQYQGITFKGKKAIIFGAHCRAPSADFDLSREMLVVMDGGACYFHVLYDPANRIFFEFRFNGVA